MYVGWHAWPAVRVDLEVGAHRRRLDDVAAIQRQLEAARRASGTRLDNGGGDLLLQRVGQGSRRDSRDVDVTLTWDVAAESNRPDEVHADEIGAEYAAESVVDAITEIGDLWQQHPAIIE
jgi:hypothetical protein